jgi:hypothetical protein
MRTDGVKGVDVAVHPKKGDVAPLGLHELAVPRFQLVELGDPDSCHGSSLKRLKRPTDGLPGFARKTGGMNATPQQ